MASGGTRAGGRPHAVVIGTGLGGLAAAIRMGARGSLKGAGFRMEPVLLQSAYFRPHNSSEDIENLFLVGVGTRPGAGVLSSAKVLQRVLRSVDAFDNTEREPVLSVSMPEEVHAT